MGFFVAAEYWVTEASLTGAYALDGNVLTFQASSSTHAAFTVDGVASIAIPYSLPERAHLLKHWELRARSCTSGAACRDSVVVRFPSGALGIMDPVSDAIDLDQEVPW